MSFKEKKYKQQITLGQPGNALMMLIGICLIMFVGLQFMKAVWFFRYNDTKDIALSLYNNNVLALFTLPAEIDALGKRPWALLTHMFVHDNIWRVFANMLWLWCFGYMLQDMTGNRKIIPLFIYGAIGGAIAFILAYNFLPSLQAFAPGATAMGASAGVMAVAIAATLISPGYRIFPMIGGGIPIWVLTAIYVISDLATVSIGDSGNLLAHIAGAFTGFLFIFFLRQGFDWSDWMNRFFDWVTNLFNPDRPRKGTISTREELFYKATRKPYKKIPNVTPQRVDEILDKISQKGYQFLTEEEKDLLRRASEEDD